MIDKSTQERLKDASATLKHDKRMRELRVKALMALGIMFPPGFRYQVTQVGKRGFHYLLGNEAIPKFQAWCEKTKKANAEFF